MLETSPPTTILVVEDNTILGTFMTEFLKEELNAQAFLALNGQQALAMIDTIKPDIFVLDYQLPDMNGLDLYDCLHALVGLEEVPALVVSANPPLKKMKQRHLSSLQKPFNLDDLLLRIQQLLEREKLPF